MARKVSGTIPSGTDAGFRDGAAAPIGYQADLSALTEDWELITGSIAFTSTDFAITLANGTYKIEVAEYRVCEDYLLPVPVNSQIEVAHIPNNSFAWDPGAGTFAFAFKVSGINATSFPQSSAYIFDCGNWSLRWDRDTDTMILEINGTDRITKTSIPIDSEWHVARVDYDTSGSGEVGLKIDKGTRQTYVTTDIPTTTRIDIGGSTASTLPIYGLCGLIHFDMGAVTDESDWEDAVDEFKQDANEFSSRYIESS